MKKVSIWAVSFAMLMGAAVLAPSLKATSDSDLQKAKNEGKICEKGDGYVLAKDASAQELANRVNAERDKKYAEIAQKNNEKKEDVAKVFGERLGPRC